MTGCPPTTRRRARAAGGALALLGVGLAALLAGCGGVAGGDDDLGYPPAPAKIARATVLVADLSGERLQVPVPTGWGLARIDRTAPARALVIRATPCYLSISITGSTVRPLTVSGIDGLYANPSDGYNWTRERYGRVIVALLDQSEGARLSRSTVGSAYIPVDAGNYLAVDFGAGVWPIGSDHACPDPDVVAHLDELRSTVETVFAAMVVSPASGGAASAALPTLAIGPTGVVYAERRRRA